MEPGRTGLRGTLVPLAFGLAIAAAVCFPFVGGRLFLLDWVIGPHHPVIPSGAYGLGGGVISGLPLTVLVGAATRALGASVTWLPVIVVFAVAAVGAAHLAGGNLGSRLGAATLYCVNPFVFERLYAGQLAVLLGYALLPFAVAPLVRAPAGPTRRWLVPALWWAGLVALTVHFTWILGVVLVAVLVRHRRRPRVLRGAALAIAAAGAMSLYLVVAHLGQPLPATVGTHDLLAYRTRASTRFGLVVNVLGLYGFFHPAARLPKSYLAGWPLLLGALLVVVIAGAVVGLRDPRRRDLASVLCLTGLMGLLLALGDQGPTGPLFRWAYLHVPGFAVMREPEKFSCLLALAYAVFFGWGAEATARTLHARPRMVTATAVGLGITLPFLYTPTIVDGLGGQVRASHLSSSWAQADKLMGTGPGKVLALPWHEYLAFPFTQGRVIANPTGGLFGRQVISGDNVQLLPLVQSNSTSQRSAYLQYLFRHGTQTDGFGALVAPLGIRYVALAKTVDWASYGWLNRQADLRLVLDRPDLAVYRVTEPVDVGARTTRLTPISGWDQLLAQANGSTASRLALARSAPVFARTPAGPTPPGVHDPATGATITRRSPVSYHVPAGIAGWAVVPQQWEPTWTLDGHQATELAIGTMAVRAGPAAGTIAFGHWNTVRTGYLLSLLALVLTAGAVLLTGRPRNPTTTRLVAGPPAPESRHTPHEGPVGLRVPGPEPEEGGKGCVD
ncbi:MAG: hypothetical protein ACYCYA_05160 [Actinomycetes bacterium]